MRVRELIELLERQDPDAFVVISKQDYLGTYREPYDSGDTIFVEDCGDYFRDVTYAERDCDQPGVIL